MQADFRLCVTSSPFACYLLSSSCSPGIDLFYFNPHRCAVPGKAYEHCRYR